MDKNEKCKACLNYIRVAVGTKLVDGKRKHFNVYGCKFDKCKYEELCSHGVNWDDCPDCRH